MQAVRIRSDDSIQLPKTVLRRFPKRSELAVWTEGDVIVLKRLKAAKLSAIATRRRRPEKEMPLAEIDAEVQRHRKEKRSRKA